MGFFQSLFTPKGRIRGRVQFAGVPDGARYMYNLAFLDVGKPNLAPPRTPQEAEAFPAVWTSFSEDDSFSQKLPVGHYQILLLFMPMGRNEQGMVMFDLDAQFPFWPLARIWVALPGGQTLFTQERRDSSPTSRISGVLSSGQLPAWESRGGGEGRHQRAHAGLVVCEQSGLQHFEHVRLLGADPPAVA